MNITPKGKQEEVMALPAKGHIVVLGTAGSGKTTIALLRAYHLANMPGNDKVLLITFNGALVKYMQNMNDSCSAKLVVETYHKFALGYLDSMGKMPKYTCVLNQGRKEYYIQKAINLVKNLHPNESTLKRPLVFFTEEITFIEKFGFVSLNLYNEAERIGRASANIKRENRKWVFEVYTKYLELREEDGYKYDWDDIAYYTYREFCNDTDKRRYTHIIVDEGQDFSPMMIRSLIKAVPSNGSFTFFGDVAQQIYGSRMSWRDSGINVEKIWRFDKNYRNPYTVIKFAKDITNSKYWHRDNDMVDASGAVAEGVKPILIEFSDKLSEKDWIANRAISESKQSSVVIVCRNRSDIDEFLHILKEKGCNATEIDKNTPGYNYVKTVYLTTFHTAKGLEFDNVFIPFLIEDKLPDPNVVARSISKEETYADEIKLLYVAVTRSKYGLYMSYSGKLSPLFPKASDNYDYYREEDLL